MRTRSATPGTILCLISTVLLALASFCTPLLKSLSIFKATLSAGSIDGVLTIGVLGYCLEKNGVNSCSPVSVGYEFDLNALLNITSSKINIPEVVAKWITYVLVLHIVALGLAGIATIVGILAHCDGFVLSCVSSCFSGMAGSITLIAFIFDLVIYFVAKSRISSIPGASCSIGIATWLTLAAWICLFLSGCAFSFGSRCIPNRRTRDREASTRSGPDRLEPDKSYADEARLEALRAEDERKLRAGGTGGGLPGFQPYESQTQPLNRTNDEYLHEEEAEEDVGMARQGAYQQQLQQGVGAAAGIGMGRPGVGERQGSDDGRSNRAGYGAGQRSYPSDSYYAGGQATPGGYPAVQEDSGYYNSDPYHDPYAAPLPIPSQAPYRQPSADPYSNQHNPNDAYNNASAYAQPQSDYHQQQSPSSLSHYSQASPIPTSSSHQTMHDPRAIQSGFVSPPHQQQQQPSQYLQPSSSQYQAQSNPNGQPSSPSPSPSSAYGGYAPDSRLPSPAPALILVAPSPQRLAHPAALTPGGGGEGVRGLPEPPSYEMASVGGAGPSDARGGGARPEKSSYYTGGR